MNINRYINQSEDLITTINKVKLILDHIEELEYERQDFFEKKLSDVLTYGDVINTLINVEQELKDVKIAREFVEDVEILSEDIEEEEEGEFVL